jgi:hypothetical protein
MARRHPRPLAARDIAYKQHGLFLQKIIAIRRNRDFTDRLLFSATTVFCIDLQPKNDKKNRVNALIYDAPTIELPLKVTGIFQYLLAQSGSTIEKAHTP